VDVAQIGTKLLPMLHLQCARCIAVHGAPGCPATHTDLDGEPSCTWHLDGELCPIEQKQQRAARKNPPETPPAAEGNSEKPAESEQESGVTTMKTPEPDPTSTPKKICAKPDCGRELSAANSCGLCRGHVRWQAHTSSAGNGHEAAGSNGVQKAGKSDTTKANGNGHSATPAAVDFLESRLDRLLLNLPADDKFRICQQWLSGAI